MAIIRKLLAHDENEDNQWLKVDHSTRYIENNGSEWQFLFGPNSELNNSAQIIKIAAKFNENTFNDIQLIGYLYEPLNAAIANASSCQFKIHKITTPNWTETLILTVSGTQLSNNYFYVNPSISAFGLDFQGGDSIMIEATMTRLGTIYRDRIYVNHLGIYDNVYRLRQEVEFISITKADE